MILAALGDVHGNLPALEAVLRAIDEEGIERVVNTGDCAVGCPWPNEVIEALEARHILTVQGHTDRQVVRFLRKHDTLRRKLDEEELAALQHAYETLSSDRLEFLRGLPKTLALTIDGVEVFLCHCGPANPSEPLRASDSDQIYQRQREVVSARIIVHGATHTPHVRTVGGTLFVNPGAVGLPETRSGHASYAVISTEDEPWSAAIRWVPYDDATAIPGTGPA